MGEQPNEGQPNVADDPTAVDDLDVTEEMSADVRGGGQDVHIVKYVDKATPKLAESI